MVRHQSDNGLSGLAARPGAGRRSRTGLRALWLVLIVTVVVSFAVLLYFGREIYQVAPPIPDSIVIADGNELFSGDDIRQGQDVWRSVGGQELGSVWGHGAYTAPDWTADWLHREALWLVESWSSDQYGAPYDNLTPQESAALQARLQSELRTNTYDPSTGAITLSADRAAAIGAVQSHNTSLFGKRSGAC